MLAKRGPLTPAERTAIEGHTVVGEQILSSVDFLSEVLPLVRHEHERWDGGGYPDGLAGEAIPLGSRIVLACDAYDAMTSDRPYRAAMTDAQARSELLAGAGTPVRRARGGRAAAGAGRGRRSAGGEPRQVVLPAASVARPPSACRRAPPGVRLSASASAASGPASPARKSNTVPPSTSASRAAGGNDGPAALAQPPGHGRPHVRDLARPGRWPTPSLTHAMRR